MKTAREWRHEAYVAAMKDDAMTIDAFIVAVQRDAFDAGVCAILNDMRAYGQITPEVVREYTSQKSLEATRWRP